MQVLESTVAFAKTTIGTPYYLSPEICMERPYSFSSDIWALGCVLYELACLRVPFDAQNLQSLVQKITRGPTPLLPSNYSAELRQLGGDLLHRDQNARPSAQEILQRPLIQQEIRRMLREEQSKGNTRASARSSSGPSDTSSEALGSPAQATACGQQMAAVPPAPGGERSPNPGAVIRRLPDSAMRKSPSIQSEGGRGDANSGEEGGLSSRHRQNNPAALLKGVGASVCMEGGGGRIQDAVPQVPARAQYSAVSGVTPGRQWGAEPVAAGGPSRLGTPAGLKFGSRRY